MKKRNPAWIAAAVLLVWVANALADPGSAPAPLVSADSLKERTQRFVKALEKSDFEALDNELIALRKNREKTYNGWGSYYMVGNMLAEAMMLQPKEYLGLLNSWCDQRARSFDARLLRGVFFIEYAWNARGHGWASEVPEEDMELFISRLEQATEDLVGAAKMDDSSADPYIHLIHIAKGLGSNENAQQWFMAALDRDPDRLEVYRDRFDSLRPRWGGSQEKMFGFARIAARHHPKNPEFGKLILWAHRDAAVHLDPNGKLDTDTEELYFRQSEVWDEISKISKDHMQAFPDDILMLNYYALYAHYAGHYDIADEKFTVIGDRWFTEVWNDETTFKAVKNWVSYKARGVYDQDINIEVLKSKYDNALAPAETDKKALGQAYYAKGYELYAQHKYAEAIHYIEQSIEKDPLNADAYYLLGDYNRAELKDLPKAIAAYQKALEINPNHPYARTEMERTQAVMGPEKKYSPEATQFIQAAEKGDTKKVQSFIAKGMDVNVRDLKGGTALMWAANNGYTEIATDLLKNGANVNLQDKDGASPLMVSAAKGHQKIVQLLLVHDVDVNAKQKQGSAALFAAIENGHAAIVEQLLARGAEVNIKRELGITPLILATQKLYPDIVWSLLIHGADVNAKSDSGLTALMVSERSGGYNPLKLFKAREISNILKYAGAQK